MSLNQITPAALQLAPRDRATLAESLWASLEDPYEVPANLTDTEALRLALARDAELESGSVAPLSHDDLMSRLRQ